MSVWNYDEGGSRLHIQPYENDCSAWCLVLVPPGFPVLDVLLVRRPRQRVEPAFYPIQITRAADPFSTHYTYDTCSSASKARVDALFTVVSIALSLLSASHCPPSSSAASSSAVDSDLHSSAAADPLTSCAHGTKDARSDQGAKLFKEVLVRFVMVAPNASSGRHVAPGALQPYYFSPAEIVSGNSVTCLAAAARSKRRLSDGMQLCCRCTAGDCSQGRCGKKATSCTSCRSSVCPVKRS